MGSNHLTIKTYMAIMAERDAAIRDRNTALEERKKAFAERDKAMLQRDAAIAEHNAAMQERNVAIAALQLHEKALHIKFFGSPADGIADGSNDSYHEQIAQNVMADAVFSGKDVFCSNMMNVVEVASDHAKPVKMRQAEFLSKPLISTTANCWGKEHDAKTEEELDRQIVAWKDNLGLNHIDFDESTMPVPVCTCTGTPQPCYKWGSGGWQSACCTTSISMYPLPQLLNKRYARIGGRKMSGSAFNKLLNRLAANGQDLYSAPLDLKDHWAKHGTNRYSTLK